MEPVVKKRRGRKRKINDVQDVVADCGGKKKAVKTRSLKLVGQYVRKDFQESGLFLGKIMSYDSGLYRINYEDGDSEDLDSSEVKAFLIDDDDLTGEWSERKENLNKLFLGEDANATLMKVENVLEVKNLGQADSSVTGILSNDETGACVEGDSGYGDPDTDSSSDSCEDAHEQDIGSDLEEPLAPAPELPPSSGHIGVPEEYVSHLFSVHNFLRSFSAPLFLYPFGLDDFVGALNCSVVNSLLDSVHVALLRVLKRHIERLSLAGAELALKCMRCLDWSLLDTLTWPVFLVHYLVIMGYTNGPDWKEFYSHSLEKDYYSLSAGKKLVVLQILCDEVLDSEELRAEMDMREESEVGLDMETSTIFTRTSVSRRVNSRFCRTSQNVLEQHATASSLVSNSTIVGRLDENSAGEDGNGDECRLCGMDGLLLCCDGCPSSYHPRCIGVNKVHVPEGLWYCPHCAINKAEPEILKGTMLRGGHNFGADRYGQTFFATSGHLLVLKGSVNSGVCFRYYSRQDIPVVLCSLYLTTEHVVTYSEICRGIIQYWELPDDILPCYKMSKECINLRNEKGGGECTANSDNLLGQLTSEASVVEKGVGNSTSGITVAGGANSSLANCIHDAAFSGNFFDTLANPNQVEKTDSTRQQSHPTLDLSRLSGEPTSCSGSGSISHPADKNEISQQSSSSITRNISINSPTDASQQAKMLCPHPEHNSKLDQKSNRNTFDVCYMGISFKAAGYVNSYVHGDLAAAAAANLAVLSSEENQVPDSRNRGKVLSDNVILQVKVFSSVATRFFWPNAEKKLAEVPRERCTWCLFCKAPVASRRGCLLNAAASNAIKGTTKVLSGVRPLKNGDGRLLDISMYIMFMEETLSGLLVGPFLDETFRKRWCKHVEQATTSSEIKILLIELEENMRTIALSGDWVKLSDVSSTRASTSQIAVNAVASMQKHRPGRRGRKPSYIVEVASDGNKDTSTDFTWWRGGKLSKLMFQRGLLPGSMIRKAALRCGLKKIPGIHYIEGDEIPKTSKQLLWRSAVERSRNIAQLALQVRYLDFHVRWSELVRPEQAPSDGKGYDAEASAFRNAFICDKKTVEREIRYCIAFGGQKHLPSRIMKNVAELEQVQDDGKARYWFSEIRIPLYLIKEYEENLKSNKPVNVLSALLRRQQRARRRNIFTYLWRKQNGMLQSNCCSCLQDIFHWEAVKCSACQGFCHEKCSNSSTVHPNKDIEYLVTCKKCCEIRAATQVQNSYGSPTSPLLLQTRNFPNAATTNRSRNLVGHKGRRTSGGTTKYSSERKATNETAVAKKSKASKSKHWGLIWKKNNCQDTGMDFRLENILLKGNPNINLINPVCRLCYQEYNADLMYVRCETCQYWFHADALELDESKVFELVGFKCCKCRRIKSPPCPYMDPQKKKTLEQKLESKAPKVDSLSTKAEVTCLAAEDPLLFFPCEVQQCSSMPEVDYGSNYAAESGSARWKLPVRRHINPSQNEVSNTTEEGRDLTHTLDAFLVEVPTPFDGNDFNPTEKLPVRRHAKKENHPYFHSPINPSQNEVSNTTEDNLSCRQDSLPPQAQWTASEDNFDDGIVLDYEDLDCDDINFEPQTYFSFHELLASDDGAHLNGHESTPATENWETSGLPENGTLEISYDEEEPIISVGTTIDLMPCNMCSNTEPYPDLFCQTCGMWIHRQCSPWVESSTEENAWRCGKCREWR